MAVIQLEAQVSSVQLLRALEQMPSEELDRFVEQALALHAQRSAAHLDRTESELLLQINRGIPPERRERYETLLAKRQAETLNSEEYTELLRLTEQIEQLDASRLTALAELARLRHTSLVELMRTLGIQPPDYA
ncbi:MAG TPA: STAS/SEC14 domain-containing protein [Candidatus Competibacteraceae bacterium]|nr:STAS/SEC14 domain-containing protein [Candidatus Competibacteraceae bacterium]